ncbi:MAG: YkgJ family cysteine cluster protein [Chlamydiae bacterium]|nr:YkgJ family cysteine cluster protein [Chlamydiota bacterium]
MSSEKIPRWYKDGLHFKCTGCGACCTGSPGYVFLTEEDEQLIAKELNISIVEFQKTYTRLFMGRRSLNEDPKNYDCVFLKNNRCSLYQSRPKQCRTYPFWSGIMQKKSHWEEEKNHCEGIEHPDSKFYTEAEIETILKERSETK